MKRTRWGLARKLYTTAMVRLRRWLILCHVSVRPLRTDVPAEYGDGIKLRVMADADFERNLRWPANQIDPDFVKAAQTRGDLCLAALDGDRVVSFCWVSFTRAPAGDGLWVDAHKPNRYGYKVFTDPDYRGRRLQDGVLHLSDSICIERGYTHNIGYIETHNFASILADTRRGGVFVGYAGYLRLFGRVWPFRSPGARRHGFRFYRPARESATAIQ